MRKLEMNLSRFLFCSPLLLIAVTLSFLVGSQRAYALDPKLPGQLTQYLDSLKSVDGYQNATFGVRVLEASTGREVFSYGANTPMVPASVMKIVTSAAALKYLGADYSFPTEVFVIRDPRVHDVRLDPGGGVVDSKLKNSPVAPDIVIRGYGDPTLVEEDLYVLAGRIKSLGFTKVRNIIIDDTLFIDPTPASGYRPYQAGVSATSVNNNSYYVSAAPSPRLDKAFVTITRGLGYSLTNRLKTRNSRGSSIKVIQSPPSVTFNPKAHGPRIGPYFKFPKEKVSIQVSGKISRGSALEQKYFSVRNPSKYFADLLSYQLKTAGVEVLGETMRGETPREAELVFTHNSDTLKDILSKMNHYSSNHIASQILFALGQDSNGYFKRELGLERISSVLSSLNFKPEEFVVADASGLDPSNRLSASHLVAVLAAVYQDFSLSPDFVSSLSRFGNSGTLKKRQLYKAPVGGVSPDSVFSKLSRRANAVWAKTGTLTGVSSLAGYLLSRDEERYAFAIIVNGASSKDAAMKAEDELIKRIAGIQER
jgi:D-alanyl-D-alanine carboxypeptidase/D-alanyl-D-alanine-endopeptidase (penicillin-binding protein 4)